ncbi:hypothetical protein DY000_02000472 [Brassica cretica]|uniref:GTP-binding protein n=1 Tax=Brassica cretica TaxID=69181 RepID=A0ABQ7CAX9_BRACR|nr:hypothetical protein DY000_02000472 [Brassica cretica]
MMLAQLPRLHLSIFAKSHFSLASSHFNFINPNPPVKLARTLFSSVATVEPIPLPVSDSSHLEDAPMEIPLDKLFIPPETNISGDDPYASAPHELKKDWNKFTKDYFLNRSTLVSVFLLVDASLPAKQIDLDYASWLGQNQVPMTMVFTKCDKRKKKKNGGKRPEENIKEFQDLIQGFFETTPPWIMTSSVTNQGRDEILLHMAQLRNYWLKH